MSDFSFPPSGFDRATGLPAGSGTLPGTLTPFGARLISNLANNETIFEEIPDSPVIDRGEQATIVHRFMCDPVTARTLIDSNFRGLELVDSTGNLTRILSARYEYQRGDRVIIGITAESLSFDTPPAEFSVDVIEFNPALQKHPRYAPMTRENIQQVLSLLNSQDYLRVADFSNILGINTVDSMSPAPQQASAELLAKFRKGIDTFYLPGFRVSFSTFYYHPQPLNPGGFIQDPYPDQLIDPATGIVFWSSNGTFGGNNIFLEDTATINPMLYGNGITWLRLADTYTYQRTWFRLTQNWIGAPAGGFVNILSTDYAWKGHFDENIYNREFNGYNLAVNQ